MPNQWFRFYSEWSDDPKVQMMPEHMQRRLAMLFCERCKGETLHETQRAFHWRISLSNLSETKELFMSQGFIDEDWNLINWNRRQFLSDSSTDRVRKHRQALKQSETLQKQNGVFHETGLSVSVSDSVSASVSGISAHMIAKQVMTAAKMTSDTVLRSIASQAQLEIGEGDASEEKANQIVAAMVHAWASFRGHVSANKMEFQWTAQKFYGEGYWRDESGWPWRKESNGKVSADTLRVNRRDAAFAEAKRILDSGEPTRASGGQGR